MTRFASLTAGLLARKGEAEPSATPFADQLLTRVGANGPDMRRPAPPSLDSFVVKSAPKPAFRFTQPAPAEPLDELPPVIESHDEEQEHQKCSPCAAPGGDDQAKTFHVNLRLKRPRFVKLKLSAALLRRPVQDIVSEALDAWFDKLPPDVLGDCACMRSSKD